MRASELVVLITGDAAGLRNELRRSEESLAAFEKKASTGAAGAKAAETATTGLAASMRALSRDVALAGDSSKTAALKYELFRGELKKADESLKSQALALARVADAQNRVKAAAQSFGPTMTTYVTAPILGLGAAALSSFQKLDSLRRGLVSVMGTAAAADAELVKLREVAKLPGLGFQDAAEGSLRLQAAGLSAATARDSLLGFGNALASVGKGKAELDGVTLALSQIQSKGKVSAEEINQLAERLPQIRKALVEVFGTGDAEKLQALNIPVDKFLSELNRYFLAQKRVTGGIKNDLENASDSIQQSLSTLGEAVAPLASSFLSVLVPAVEGAANRFKALSPAAQDFTIKAGLALAAVGPLTLAVRGLVSAVTTLGALRTAAVAFFAGAGDAASANVAKVVAFRNALTLSPGAAAGAIGAGSVGLAVAGAGLVGAGIGNEINDRAIGSIDRQAAAVEAERRAMLEAAPAFAAYLQARERLKRLDETIANDGRVTERERAYRAAVVETVEALKAKAEAERGTNGTAGARSPLVAEAENAKRLAAVTKSVAEETAKLREEMALMGQESRANRLRFDFFQSSAADSGHARILGITNPAQRAEALRQAQEAIKLAEAADRQDEALKARAKALDEQKQRLEALRREQQQYRESVVSDVLTLQKTLKLGDDTTEASRVSWEAYAKAQAVALAKLPVDRLVAMRAELAAQADAAKRAAASTKAFGEALVEAFDAERRARAEAAAAASGRSLTLVEKFDLDRQKQGSAESGLSPGQAAKVRAQLENAQAAEEVKAGTESLFKLVDDLRGKLRDRAASLRQELAETTGSAQKSVAAQVEATLFGASGDASAEALDGLRKKVDDLVAATGDSKVKAALLKLRDTIGGPEFESLRAEIRKLAGEADAARAQAKADADAAKVAERLQAARGNASGFLENERERLGARTADAEAALRTRAEQFRASLERGLAERLKGTSATVEEYRSQIDALVESYRTAEEAEREAAAEKSFANHIDGLKRRAAELREALKGATEPSLVRQAREAFASDPANVALRRDGETDPAKLEEYRKRLAAVVGEAYDTSRIEAVVEFATSASERVAGVFVDSFGKIGDGFRSVFGSIRSGFESLLSDLAAQYLRSVLAKALTRIIGNAVGGDFASVVNGGGAGRALGGPVYPGNVYRVRELENEFFVPQVQGRIVSGSQLANRAASEVSRSRPAPASTTIVFNVTTPDAESFRRSGPQITRELARMSEYEKRRS